MFASTLLAGTTTGVIDNGYALGLKSGTTCEAVTLADISSYCMVSAGIGSGSSGSAVSGWNTSLVVPGEVRVDICLPVYESTSIWDRAGSKPWQPQSLTEDIYIGVQEIGSGEAVEWGCLGCLGTDTSPAGLYIHCRLDTTLAYFEAGHAATHGIPSPFLDETPSSFNVPNGTVMNQHSSANPAPEPPLMTTAQAMFGNNSWLATVGSFLDLVDATGGGNYSEYSPFVQLVCQMRPLVNSADYFQGTTYDFCDLGQYDLAGFDSPAAFFGAHVRSFFSIFELAEKARAVFNTGAFFANDYILTAALDQAYGYAYERDNLTTSIYGWDGVQTLPVVPVVSTAGKAVISLIIALQAISVLLIVAYSYKARVWTKTLDALAMARIGAQLSRTDPDEGGPLGVEPISRAKRDKLLRRDGMIDTCSSGPTAHAARRREEDNELGLMPPPYTPRTREAGQGEASS